MRPDIIVGVPTLNEAGTIEHVVSVIDQALRVHFPDCESLIVNVDNNSVDGTGKTFLARPTRVSKLALATPQGVIGKGANVRLFLELVDAMAPAGACIIDGDVESIAPRWIDRLLRPIVRDGSAFVTPAYATSQGGPLTNLVCRPLLCGIFGLNIPQPIGGECGFDTAFARHMRLRGIEDEALGYGVDILLSTEACMSGRRVDIAQLGEKRHRGRPWHSIGPIATDVVATLLRQAWRDGSAADAGHLRASLVRVNRFTGSAACIEWAVDETALAERFRVALWESEPTYRVSLPSELHQAIRDVAGHEQTALGHEIWIEALSEIVTHSVRTRAGAKRSAAAIVGLLFGRMISYAHELATAARPAVTARHG